MAGEYDSHLSDAVALRISWAEVRAREQRGATGMWSGRRGRNIGVTFRELEFTGFPPPVPPVPQTS